ncbi:MAG: flagellar filament capping protein FliD [Phycisphaerales bacterium]
MSDVVDTINEQTGIRVIASIKNDAITLNDESTGTGNFIVQDIGGTTTASDLGITGNVDDDTIEGAKINLIGATTMLASLNDDNGVFIRDNVSDFRIQIGGDGGVIHAIDLGRKDAEIDFETLLKDLNDGDGIRINDTDGQADFSIVTSDGTQVDISLGEIRDDDGELLSETVTTVQEMLTRVNETLETELGSGQVIMSVRDDGQGFSLVDSMGGSGALEVIGAGPFDDETAEDLGIFTGAGGGAGNTIIGERIPNTVEIARATTIQEVIDRINDQTEGAVTASINANGKGISFNASGELVKILDDGVGGDYGSQTLIDLGFELNAEAVGLEGKRILGGVGTSLIASINGGSGLEGRTDITFTDREGDSFTITGLDEFDTIDELIMSAENQLKQAGVEITIRLNAEGNGLALADLSNGVGNLVVSGTAAEALGIATNTASDTVRGLNIQREYVSASTDLDDLNYGRGVGVGKFKVTDGNGFTATVDIGSDSTSLYDVMREINSRGLDVEARINDHGDGMILIDTSTDGSRAIKVESVSGSTARDLGIIGEATEVGGAIDGSYEKTLDLDLTDTLNEVIGKVNDSGFAVSASLLNTNTGGSPLRLVLSSEISGLDGDLIVDTGGVDLGFNELTKAKNAKVFIGEGSGGVLVESTSNVINNIVAGVELDLQSASDTPITVNVSRDEEGIMEGVQLFVDSFNEVVGRINEFDVFDAENEIRGPLLGDPTVAKIKQDMYRTLQQSAVGIETQFRFLSEVGIRIGAEGQITFDAERFKEVYADDPDAVENLFAAYESQGSSTETIAPGVTVDRVSNDYTQLGFGDLFKQAVSKLTNSIDGTVTLASKNFDALIEAQNKRIELIDERLAAKEARLFREFTAMEVALARLQSQQSSIGLISQNLAIAGSLFG